MRGVRIGGVVLVVAFTTLPWLLSSRGVTLAQQDAAPGIARVCQNCGTATGYTHFFTCAPGTSEATELRLEHFDASGEQAGTQTEEIPAGGCSFYRPDVPDGFDGTTVFPGDPAVHTIVVSSKNPDGTGPSSATPLAGPPDAQPTYTPMAPTFRFGIGASTPRLDVCNPGLRTARFDTFFFDEDGNRTGDFLRRGLASGLCLELDPEAIEEIFPAFGREPSTAQTFTVRDQPPSTYEVLFGGPDDVTDRVPGPGAGQGGRMPCAPVGPLGLPMSFSTRNLGSDPADVDLTTFTADGDVTSLRSVRLGAKATLRFDVPADESACVESNSRDDGGILTAAITIVRDLIGDAPELADPGGSSGTKQNGGIYLDASRLPTDPVTKRAIAFGAVRRERRTRVNVVMQNLTDRRTKARMIVRDGEGDRVFARTLRAPGHATARRKFVPRARGDDLWVEVKVRGGNKRVFLWLERIDPSGDVTLYPGVKLR